MSLASLCPIGPQPNLTARKPCAARSRPMRSVSAGVSPNRMEA